MSVKLLEQNWDSIVTKVIEPLWKYKFKSMYESAKLDKDDFMSMAGEELTKAFEKYDPDTSSIHTYAHHILTKKAETELRDCTKRDKRKALHTASSLNQPIAPDDDEEILTTIQDGQETVENDLSELRVGNFINSLSNKQLRVLILKLLEFNSSDIPDMLNISTRTMNEILKGLKGAELVRILYREEF